MGPRQHPSTPAPSTPAALSSPRSNKEMGDVLEQLRHKYEKTRATSAASTPTGASPRETSAEGGPGRSGSTRKKKRERDGLKETVTAGDQRQRQNLEPKGSKASLPIQPDLTGASPCPARQPPPAYRPPQRSTERQPSGHGPTQDDEETTWTICMGSLNSLKDWVIWALSPLVSCLAYGAKVVAYGAIVVASTAWKNWKNWNRRRRSKNARTEVTPRAVMDGNIMEDDEKAAESSPSKASRLPSRKPHRRKPHSSHALQHQELAQDPPAERPKVPPPPPPAPGIRRRLARHAGKVLAVLLLTALVLLAWYWPPRTFRSTSQPVDDLIHATHLTSAALDLLVTTATPMFNSHWYVCRIMEASEEVFVDPDVHPEFGKAWAPEKGNLGWGCPKPEVDFVDFPPPTPNEHFGRLGVLLAGELWNMTLLLRRSCAESYAMAQGAAHLATQIEDEVRLSDLCRQSSPRLTPWTSLLHLRAVFSTDRSEAPLLNAKIAQLNSTISTFTASHSSLITDLEVSATICLDRLRAWRAAALEGGIWPTPDRGPHLFGNIRALCQEFRRGRDDGQKSAPQEKMVTLWSEKEVNLPPFLVARNRFEEARGVLRGIPSADRPWNNRVVQWISQPPAIGWWDWMTGQRNGTIASWTHSRLRCWILGSRTKAPVGEGAGTQEKLLETCQRMELAAMQAGTVKLLSPKAGSSDVASEDRGVLPI
ncbi:unnamed protein product [Zymoseptoria tritici ST99CH_1E4]|uniref:Uncharacterized protein n=1 Tax=Zymoseptoria tritici ST99CH_1E4 TaxID=1276532 RepID=A0A2H1HBV4_ZYMTR|nr:unnamed protein product [Zymoseptoria tritici ST99CH_1E4]